MSNEGEFCGTREVAQRLFGDHPNAYVRVRQLIATKQLRAIRSAGDASAWWVFRDSVEEYLARSREQTE
jgi:hypothetical protein